MPLFHVPYIWSKAPIQNLRSIWFDIYYGIQNVIRWIPVIWHDRDWDWSYLANVMEYKLSRMAALTKEHGCHVGSEKHARQQLVCALLLRRLNVGIVGYSRNAQIRFGETRFASEHAIAMQKNDLAYLGKLIGKHMNCWWE